MQVIGRFVKEVVIDSTKLYWDLLKLMVPVMVIVRIGAEFGLIEQVGKVFAPFMTVLGLPPEMGIVWAASALVGIYGGAVALFGLLPDFPLTVAQMTVVSGLMLMCHGLPIEQRIVQKAGGRFWAMTLFRLLIAFLYAWILYQFYSGLNLLQDVVEIAWLPAPVDNSWVTWTKDSLITLFWIFWIILALLTVLNLMKILKITDYLTKLLAPALRIMGIGENSAPLAMVGVLLGLTFGGGLIIREARAGHLKSRSVFLTMAFMILCHSMIEDTLFLYAIGGHWSGVLVGRIIFAVLIMIFLGYIIWRIPDKYFYRFLYKQPAKE